MKAISIKQPWAHAIMHFGKDVENRDWSTKFRGTVAIHASKGMTKDDYKSFVIFACDLMIKTDIEIKLIPDFEELERGVILGTVEIVDCVDKSESDWFCGQYGFVLKNLRLLVNPIPCKGALGFWEVPKEIEAEIFTNLRG